MPAKGFKILDQVGFELPTYVHVNPQKCGQVPTVNHVLTINRYEYGTIWHCCGVPLTQKANLKKDL